ncbi:glycosyltransferase [Fusobacterium perfoetens]|uniref:glycosyltransferase n=1 Tax=Fusobacterium perfoetens TaxID=852 RepID=UPI0026EB79BC|nr:glycosyltransferase [Fusobacterium perfoetens]
MEDLKVSVIVPVYNRLEHLRALFKCLLKQSIRPYEFIISDDGSKQKIIDYIGDLIEEADFKVKYIYQEDKGFRKTRALNNAVKEAEGEILVFCDQDLFFPPDYLEKIKLKSRVGEFLMCRAHHISEKEKDSILTEIEKEDWSYESIINNIISKSYPKTLAKIYFEDKRRRLLHKFWLNKRGIKLVGMSYSLRKEDYIKVNGYDEKFQGWGHEDDDFGNRLCVAGINGRELETDLIQLHLYHYSDPTKIYSSNDKYYYDRKKEIFKKKDFYCKYGYNNSLDKDKIEVKIFKN